MVVSDGEGYFHYLPAWFIYGDWDRYSPEEAGIHSINCCDYNSRGEVRTRYTFGVALLQSPFFLVGHQLTKWQGGADAAPPKDFPAFAERDQNGNGLILRKWHPDVGAVTGYSDLYIYLAMLGGVFYAVLGLFFLVGYLRSKFSLNLSLLTAGLIFFGTNLFYYTIGEPLMSHVYSFCLFSAMLYFLPRFLAHPGWRRFTLLMLIASLSILIRPTNALLLLFMLSFEVYSITALKDRFALFLGNPLAVIWGIFILVLPWLFQLAYFRYAYEGQSWSYENEGFIYWSSPKIVEVLFSPQNGLFLYTPMVLLMLGGLVLGWRRKMVSAPGLSLIFLLATYAFASWWAWWFGAAFGHRCYVEFYALLAPALALFLQWCWQNGKAMRVILSIILVIFVYANIKMTYLYRNSLPWDGPQWSMESYGKVWGKLATPFKHWP